MILTEEEYRKKWCPHVRYGLNDAESTPAFCKASECSQWRRGEIEREEKKVYADENGTFPTHYSRTTTQGHASYKGQFWVYEHTDVDEHGRFDLIHRAKFKAKKQGFCGLAGKP